MKTLGFHHVAIQAVDVERVAAFYVAHFGLAELTRHHRDDGALRSIWLGVGATATDGFFAVEQLAPPAARGTHGYSMVALRIEVAEREAVTRRLRAAGVAIERETAFTIYVRDPEGNLVGLSHHPTARPTV